MLLAGLVMFSLGLGLTGWLKSRGMGVVSSLGASAALVVMLWALLVCFLA